MPEEKKTQKKSGNTRISRTKKNEWLLLTCSPLLGKTTKEIVAASLIMKIIEVEGHLYRILSVRIARNKIYGSGIEVRELAP
jgi:hypothetical protein